MMILHGHMSGEDNADKMMIFHCDLSGYLGTKKILNDGDPNRCPSRF